MYSKETIFNLALDALLLQYRTKAAETDARKDVLVLRSHFDIAFSSALQDMDLDSTSSQMNLEKIPGQPNNLWKFAYKYPSDCAHFRRIQSCLRSDNRYSQIPKAIRMIGPQKVIMTNQDQAVAEYISTQVSIQSLTPLAIQAIALKLATMSRSLITGKGANALIQTLQESYTLISTQAQEQDRLENENFESPAHASEYVAERLSNGT